MTDFDGDGWLDLMISWWGLQDQLRFMINRAYVLEEDSSQLLDDVLPAVSDIARDANVHRHVP